MRDQHGIECCAERCRDCKPPLYCKCECHGYMNPCLDCGQTTGHAEDCGKERDRD